MKRSLLAITVALAALTAAPAAFAHAILQESTPSNNSVVRTSPKTVSLRFNEAVETAFGSIRVYDCGGGRVDSGKIIRPTKDTVAVTIDRRLARGTYTVTWRVISADSHPVAGAFVFNVKKATPGGSCKQVFGAKTPGRATRSSSSSRALDFASSCSSSAARSRSRSSFARRPRSSAPPLPDPRGPVLRARDRGALCIVLQGAVAGGFGLSEAFRWDTIHSVLQTRFGHAFLWQIGLAVVVGALALMASRSRRLGLSAARFPLPAADDLGGRSRPDERTVGVLLRRDPHRGRVHMGRRARVHDPALLLAGQDRWPLASRAVPRFSILAVISVATLIVAGTLRGYQEVRAFHGLWDTTYGQLLLAKIALVLPLLALGAYNNRFAVPRLKKQIASVVEQRRFLRAAGTELAIMAVIVGVTAVLVTEPPAKASIKAAKYATDTVPIGPLELNYIVEPAKTGPNTIHLYFFKPEPGSQRASTRRSSRQRSRARTSGRCASRSRRSSPATTRPRPPSFRSLATGR